MSLSEQEVIQYLAGLDAESRQAAYERINAGVTLLSPPADADPRKPMWTPLGDYLDMEIPVPPFLVSSGQVIKGEITVLVARAGKGKTTLTRQRMMRWAAGLPLFDGLKESQVPVRPLKIGLLENEGVAYDMRDKLAHLYKSAGLNKEQQDLARENLTIWGDGSWSGIKMDDPEKLEEFDWNMGQRPDIDLVIMEPFRGLWRGEENDSTQMEAMLDQIVALATKHDIAVMISHHERKSGAGEDGEWMSAARGSGVLEGKVAVMENFRSVKEGQYRELSWSKSRYAPPRGSIRMEYVEEDHQYVRVAEGAVAQEIKAFLTAADGDWFSVAELTEETGEHENKVRDALHELYDDLDKDDRVVEKAQKPSRGPGAYYRIASGEENGDRKLGM